MQYAPRVCTLVLFIGVLGGFETTTWLDIPRLFITFSLVCELAVAVSAIKFVLGGANARISDMLANSERKLSTLCKKQH